MTEATPLDCVGLSTTLTYLRIKQALLSPVKSEQTIAVKLSQNCDRTLLIDALGALASQVQFQQPQLSHD